MVLLGGYIYVMCGIFVLVNFEVEVVGVLVYELGYVVECYFVECFSK